jgi:hypothetical protein
MKKLLFILLIGMMTLNVLACGGSKGEDEEKKRVEIIESVKQ